ncbi:MAG: methylated-DNA--[protein]-cysteine S-methyltransferase [Melioribacteraceae bacterium]|nr:methylated-DNA--[protein]-cysteine S-methyltransferase [Melioribacteraceae bacterium]
MLESNFDKIYFSNYLSPIGNIIIKTNSNFVISIKFSDKIIFETKNELSELTCSQLNEYFKGVRKKFDLPLLFNGTQFQNNVWKNLIEIPYGEFMSYEKFSEIIGDKKKIRAVANANSKNPFAIVVPCHRIIGKNGKLVGYAGGLDRKKWLIEFELSNSNYQSQTLFG